MDVKARAALVREIRFEMKKRGNPSWINARDYDGPGRNPRRSDSVESYLRRAGGGDSATYDAHARWDRHRASLPKPVRVRTPRAGTDEYAGYFGDWQAHLGGTRVRGRVRKPLRRRVPDGFTPGLGKR